MCVTLDSTLISNHSCSPSTWQCFFFCKDRMTKQFCNLRRCNLIDLFLKLHTETLLTLDSTKLEHCLHLYKKKVTKETKERKLVNLHVLCVLCIGTLLLTAVKTFKTPPKGKWRLCWQRWHRHLLTMMLHLLHRSFTIHRYVIFRSYTRLIECKLNNKKQPTSR